MKKPFWQSARVLLNYKRTLAAALVGALLSAACFGAGLSMMLPVFHLLLQKQQTMDQLIQEYLINGKTGLIADFGQMLLNIVPSDPFQAFVFVMVTICVLAVIGSTGRYFHQLLVLSVVFRATMVWRARLFRRLVHAPLMSIMSRGSADNMSRVIHDSEIMAMGYVAILSKSVHAILHGSFALLAAIIINPGLSMLALVGAPVIAILLRKFGKRIRRATHQALQQRGQMIGSMNEAVGGVRVVKVHNAEGYERRRFNRINHDLFDQEMKMRKVKALSSPVVETLALFGVMLVATAAAWMIFRHGTSAEEFMTVLTLLAAGLSMMKPLSGLHNQIQESSAAAGRVMELVELPVEPVGTDAPRGAPTLPVHCKSIVFENVGFTYPTALEPALRGVTLRVEHGQRIAIVGTNGSGKSTILSLLPRLVEQQSGRVLIDDNDIANVSLRSLRSQMAVVTQETVLFEGTVADNIAYGRRHIRRELIIEAAKTAHAHKFIEALPNGYDTKLGEDGAGLSGGQAQRISIARAVLRNPAILILDEATSQIDADSEAEITRALRDISQGRTTLVIAHRLSTVIDCDVIVVMEQGAIVDQGKHDELQKRCAIYQTLTQTQLRKPNDEAA